MFIYFFFFNHILIIKRQLVVLTLAHKQYVLK